MSASEMILAAPFGIAALACVGSLVADMSGGARWAGRVGWVGMFAASIAAGFSASLQLVGSRSFGLVDPQPLFGVLAGGGGFGAIECLIFGLAGSALLGFRRGDDQEGRGGAARVLIVVTALAAAVTAASVDLVLQFIAIEVGALSAYGLVATGASDRSDEAALKYFVLGAIAAAFFVLALALAVGPSGSSSVERLGVLIHSGGPGAALAVAMLLLAVYAFKLGAFPFHSWAPDVYETSPPVLAGAMSTLPKIGVVAAAYLALRLEGGNAVSPAIAWSVAAISAASIVYGNLGGLKQTSYTRMLAYSGIAQVGYVLIGIACVGESGGRGMTLLPSMLLVGMYAVAALGAFLGAEAVRAARPEWDGTIAALGGFSRERPWTAAGMGVCMLSLTGIPLTAGFWGKFLVFAGALDYSMTMKQPVLAVLVALGALGSVVSFGYYGRVLRAMYLEGGESAEGGEGPPASPGGAPDRTVVALAVIALLGGLLPLAFGFGPIAQVFGRL